MKAQKNKRVLLLALSLLGAMLALSFASVPLYRLFCQRTGYGGTPKIVLKGANRIENRTFKIRFNADVHRDLPWSFSPLQTEMTLKAGELGLAFYRVKNDSPQSIQGIATYNVTPDKAGPYFHKVECFCFEEQIFEGNETLDMPVQFYIDPDIVKDPSLNDVKTITLSYTFFHAKHPNVLQYLGLPDTH